MNQAIANPPPRSRRLSLNLPSTVQESLTVLEKKLIAQGVDSRLASYYAHRILEGDNTLLADDLVNPFMTSKDDEFDIVFADARYQKIHQIVVRVQKKRSDSSEHFTAKLDRIVLHRYFALPIFFAMMYLMFLFAINIGGAFQDFFDITTDTIFVQGSAWLLAQMHAPDWLTALIANGVGKGINTTLTFIPVIAAMFFFYPC